MKVQAVLVNYIQGLAPVVTTEYMEEDGEDAVHALKTIKKIMLVGTEDWQLEENELPITFTFSEDLNKHMMTVHQLQEAGLLVSAFQQFFVVATRLPGESFVPVKTITTLVPRHSGKTFEQLMLDPERGFIEKVNLMQKLRNLLYKMADMGYVCMNLHGNLVHFFEDEDAWKATGVEIQTCEHFFRIPPKFDVLNVTLMATFLTIAEKKEFGGSFLPDRNAVEEMRMYWRAVFYDEYSLATSGYDTLVLHDPDLNRSYPRLMSIATLDKDSKLYKRLLALYTAIGEPEFFVEIVANTQAVAVKIEELFGTNEIVHSRGLPNLVVMMQNMRKNHLRLERQVQMPMPDPRHYPMQNGVVVDFDGQPIYAHN